MSGMITCSPMITSEKATMSDEALLPALNRFRDGVSKLIDPQREYVDGKLYWLDSAYDQLYDSLAGQQGYAHDSQPRSMPLLWIDAYLLLERIDETVAKWPQDVTEATNHQSVTVRRLQAFSDASYRPQDTSMLADRAGHLEGFAKSIKNLLLPEIVVYLRGHRCPVCGHSHIRKSDSAGSEVTTPALVIRGDEALCGACRAVWEYQKLPLLGRMLGIEPSVAIGG